MTVQVLLVEDDLNDQEMTKRLLADSDFVVFATATAAVALKFLGTSEVDVVLLDLKLPNGEGIELVRRILAKAGTTPVVLLTGQEDEELIKQAIDEGVAGFTSKRNLGRIGLLTQMHLAVKLRKPSPKHSEDSDTLQLLASKIEAMKAKGDEAIEKALETKL